MAEKDKKEESREQECSCTKDETPCDKGEDCCQNKKKKEEK